MERVSLGLVLEQIRESLKDDREKEYFEIHVERYRFILQKVVDLSLSAGAKVLDIGCYPPQLLEAIEKLGYEVYGLCAKNEPVVRDRVRAVNIEEDEIPFEKKTFDLVIMTEVVEHLLVNPVIYFKKILAVLKPRGRLIVTTPNVASLKNRVKLLLGKNVYFPLFQLEETGVKPGAVYYRHNREYLLSEVSQLLAKAGFGKVKGELFTAYTPFRPRVRQGLKAIWVAKLLFWGAEKLYPNWQDSLYLEAVKN